MNIDGLDRKSEANLCEDTWRFTFYENVRYYMNISWRYSNLKQNAHVGIFKELAFQVFGFHARFVTRTFG